jgi:hypothetical protein
LKKIPRWDVDLSNVPKFKRSLVKIEIGVVFLFRNDLSLLTTKTNLDDTKDDERWGIIKRWEY